MKKVTVNAPTNYANSMLNGSSGFLLNFDSDSGIAEVLLTTGKTAGRIWQFCLSHLSEIGTEKAVVKPSVSGSNPLTADWSPRSSDVIRDVTAANFYGK